MSGAASPTPGALDGLRVLEVASPFTQYCGKMLAELGAEVILVEPPDGSLVRQVPPLNPVGLTSASERNEAGASTAARARWPWCFSSLASKRSNRVKASAVAPAKPAST